MSDGVVPEARRCVHGAAQPICLPSSATTSRTSRANSPNSAVGICCGPSQSASSGCGWDSTMICYAHQFRHDGKLYALYNGNNYGETGIGLAVLDDVTHD